MGAGPFQRLISGASGLQVPWYLGGRYGATFLEALGLTLDATVESLVQGMRLARPLQCDASALPVLGQERKLRRYPTEPEISYRIRLSKWRQLWKHAGSHYGEMLNLQPYFLPGTIPRIRIVHQAGDGSSATWHTLEPDGTYLVHRATPSNWNFDGVTWKTVHAVTGATNSNPITIDTTVPHGLVDKQPVQIAGVGGNTAANNIWKITYINGTQFSIPVAGNGGYTSGGTVAVNLWSRWWCIVYTGGTRLTATPAYGAGELYGDGSVFGGVTEAEGLDMLANLNEFKASHSILWGLILTDDATMFDPAGTSVVNPDGSTTFPVGNWGPIIDPVTHLPTRPTTLRFFGDMGQG